jgi:ABC-type transport system involved in multi-copper enzyme maturation permease subunit
MKGLIWKDLRIFGDVFLAGVALVLASYALAFVLVYSDPDGFTWSKVIGGGASLTRFTSILICALMGGYAFAREAEDNSALFLTSLPVKRGHVAASKVIVSFSLIAVFWIVSLAILLVSMRNMGIEWNALGMVLVAMTGFIASGIFVFGVAWFLSFFLQSAVGAAFAGLLSLVPVYLAQAVARWYLATESPIFLSWAAVAFMAVGGVMGVLGGTMLYVRFGVSVNEALAALLPRRVLALAAAPENPIAERTRGSALHALLWKDCRIVRVSIALGLVVIAVPYAVAAAVSALNGEAAVYTRGGALASIGLSVLVFAFWSGVQMAHENAIGARRFLTSLPIPWVKAQWSKAGVALVPAAIVGLVNTGILIIAHNAASRDLRFDASFSWTMWNDAPYIVMGLALANGGALAFGMSWFASAYYRRPALAIILGILAGPVTIGLWAAGGTWCSGSDYGLSPLMYACAFTLLMTVALAGIVAFGSAIDARRAAFD